MKKLIGAFTALLLFCTQAFATLFGNDVSITFIPTVVASPYSSGQSLGGLQSVNVFSSPTQPSGIFDNFFLMSRGGATTAITVYIFDTNPTGSTCTNTSAFVLASADVAKLAMAPFVLTPAVVGAGTTSTVAQLTQGISVKNQDAPFTVKLYVCLVANGAITPASTTDLVATISATLD